MAINNASTKSHNKNLTFGEWLKGINTIKVSRKSERVLNLGPRWLLLILLTLGNIGNLIANEVLFWVFIELILTFLLGGLIWYSFDRLRGKTKI